MKDDTTKRREAIQALISRHPVSDQNMLVELLKQHHGINSNQTVISRDLNTLGVVKKAVKGQKIYELAETDARKEILRLAIIDIDHNETMIVVKTFPGLAPFLGDRIDALEDLDILGCLAGENVVFIAPRSTKKIAETYQSVCEKLHFIKDE